jgi:DNA-binding NarL/FixJ family response regulator
VSESLPRCIVADDHPALLAALTQFLTEHGFEVAYAAGDGAAALAAAERLRPEVALLDYRMPQPGGAELVRRLKAVSPQTEVAVYTAEADRALVEEARAAGASAVILKEAPLADVVRALESIRAGRPYLDAAIAARALGVRGDDPAALTPRQSDVLRLLADGLTHEQVGQRLQISAETARTHLRKACERLGAPTRTSAVARALRLGLID